MDKKNKISEFISLAIFMTFTFLCMCTLHVSSFAEDVPEHEDPIAAIAERYTERIVCPAKHAGLYLRGDHLMRIVKDHQAEGVIVMILKFCDPHGFDYPYLKQRLEAENIPHLLLELDAQPSASAQLRTRIEAFIESL